jgi:DNA topoisomerase-1
LLAIGKDAKGRPQYVYSQRFRDSQSAAKFARIEALEKERPLIEKQLAEKERSKDQNERDHADCARLVMEMGVRPGSDTDTKAKEKGYGATTLEGRHVVTEGENTRLIFTGKDGVHLDLPVDDHRLAANLRDRAEKAGENGRLFGRVRDNTLLDFVHGLDHGDYKTKDFRTLLANQIAAKTIEKMSAPSGEKEYRNSVMSVAREVSSRLGNTPTIALQSYINPTVFGGWRGHAS